MSGQWRFGLEEWDESGYRIVEKPVSFHGDGYYGNPHIYDAEGFRVVGCDEYDVFGDFSAPEGQRESVVRLLLAAPELLEAATDALAVMESIWQARGRDDDFIRDEMGSELSRSYFLLRAACRKATGAAE